jgi:small subunit ribosomal protein S6
VVLYESVIYFIPCSFLWKGARDQKEVTSMNKYELAVVVSAKIEDDERAATVDKCKALIERFGGTITNVDEWGKKRLAYEIQKMREAFYYFIQFDAESTVPAEIESRIRIMDNVIRYLCVRQNEA